MRRKSFPITNAQFLDQGRMYLIKKDRGQLLPAIYMGTFSADEGEDKLMFATLETVTGKTAQTAEEFLIDDQSDVFSIDSASRIL